MEVLQSNLNGEVSANNFFKSMPAVEVFPYQCSPLSTPEGIQGAFDSARKYRVEGSKTIVCVLLDEVGLAEESPHLPLKVLHRELEHLDGLACVGISNWTLDAAKMSRCVTLYRPPPTVDDLCSTAEGMVASANLKAYLQSLSRAFFEVYGSQQRPDFWGLREFYSTVRVVNAELRQKVAESEAASASVAKSKDAAIVLEPESLMKTVLRNYGGRPHVELETVLEVFSRQCGMSLVNVSRPSTPELIKQNLCDPEARHLMLLTRNNAALRLLFEAGLLSHDRAEVLFGSTFQGDQGDVAVASMLQSIKAIMRLPVVLVLVHCDALYESLYDLLNQHYMEYGGQRYVRIAHGSSSRQCPLHRLFRVIVITEVGDAYHRLAPPLLNRFEKQIFLRDALLQDDDRRLLVALWRLVIALARDSGYAVGTDLEVDAANEERSEQLSLDGVGLRRMLPGAHPGLLTSLVLAVRAAPFARARQQVGTAAPSEEGEPKSAPGERAAFDVDTCIRAAARRLVWALQPEAVCACIGRERSELRDLFGLDVGREYFERQSHGDLPQFVKWLKESRDAWCDMLGAQACVLTRTPAGAAAPLHALLAECDGKLSADVVTLHELSTSQDLSRSVTEFYKGTQELLLIQSDLGACSPRMLEHCRFVCEKCRVDFVAQAEEGASARFVVVLVHLQQLTAQRFCFDFDAKWWHAFLDELAPQQASGLPSLTKMLNAPFCDVITSMNASWLMSRCFRAALARLIYPHARTADDLRGQIALLLSMFDCSDLVTLLWDPFLAALGSSAVGKDSRWYVRVGVSSHEVALAGTFQAALHRRITTVQTEALVVFLGQLDRNGGLAIFAHPEKRESWLVLARHVLGSPAVRGALAQAIAAPSSALHDVGHDALTINRPFAARYPFSWVVSSAVDGLRGTLEGVSPADLPSTLATQFQLMELRHAVPAREVLPKALLWDYMLDFTAMHLAWSPRLPRTEQAAFLQLLMSRVLKRNPETVLDVHAAFWLVERRARFGARLLGVVPKVAESWRELITGVISEVELNLQMLRTASETLLNELLGLEGITSHCAAQLSDWLHRVDVASGVAQELLDEGARQSTVPLTALLQEIKSVTLTRQQLSRAFVELVVLPLRLHSKDVVRWLAVLTRAPYAADTLTAILACAQEFLADNAAECFSEFLEFWILDICLVDAAAISALPDDCVDMLCGVAAGRPLVLGVDGVAKVAAQTSELPHCLAVVGEGVLPRSRPLELAMVRGLIGDRAGNTPARKPLLELLRQDVANKGYLDTSFAVRVLSVEEELASPEMTVDWRWNASSVFGSEVSPEDSLRGLAEARLALERYAKALLSGSNADVSRCHDSIASALVHDEGSADVPIRSMRLLVLKHLHRAVGTAQVRTMLLQPPLVNAPWVVAWRQQDDVAFNRFICGAQLPQWNPFADLSGYMASARLLVDFMASCDISKLSGFARSLSSKPRLEARGDLATFMVTCSEQLGLRRAIESVGTHPPAWRGRFSRWLHFASELPLEESVERSLIVLFAGNTSSLGCLRPAERAALDIFQIDLNSPMEKMLKFRVLAHLASTLLSAPDGSVLALLKAVVMSPDDLKESYLPVMEEDLRQVLQSAMREIDNNIYANSAHWYTCPRGHQYFIADCGRPTEEAICPECGEHIGGKSHESAKGNTQLQDEDSSPAGYTLKDVSDEDPAADAFRGVGRNSARTMRLLLHGAMLLGLVARAPMPSPHDGEGASDEATPANSRRVASVGALRRGSASRGELGGSPLPLSSPEGRSAQVPNTRQAGALRPARGQGQSAPYYRSAESEPLNARDGVTASRRSTSVPALRKLSSIDGTTVAMAAKRELPECRFSLSAHGGKRGEARGRSDRSSRDGLEPSLRAAAQEAPLVVYQPLANMDFTSLGPCEADFVRRHFDDDWKRLVDCLGTNTEDLAGALHLVLHAMCESVPRKTHAASGTTGRGRGRERGGNGLDGRGVLVGNDRDDGGRSSSGDCVGAPMETSWIPMTRDRRLAWEKTLDSQYLGPCWESLSSRVPAAMARWGGGETEVLVADLREIVDARALPQEVRRKQLPLLLAYRASPSLAGLRAAMNSQSRSRQEFPLLVMLLEPPLLDFLAALRHLASVLRWNQLVLGRFSCRLERSHARKSSVREILATRVPPEELSEWKAAFEGYRLAWVAAWRFVERYECMTIPREYANLNITDETPFAFLIADPADECLCALAFTQWLVQQHNQIVAFVAALLNANPSASEVSSRLLGAQETLRYDERELLLFTRSRCVAYGAGGRLEYDLAKLERHLRRQLHAPLIKWEHKKFRFLEDQVSATSVLRAAVAQRPLPQDLAIRLASDLTSISVAASCAQLVEQSIAFLLSTGTTAALDEDVGSLLLSDYLRRVLLVTERLPSASAEADIRLCHLDGFLKLLQSHMEYDPMEGVAEKYRTPLGPAAEAVLRKAAVEMQMAELLPALQDFASEHLREEGLNAAESMKTVLAMVQTSAGSDLGDAEWFQQHFPRDCLQMCHWVAVFEALSGSS
eukprot:TRINITY_DN30416_c0_g1_i1.p1 TRINITY_DN30416_c0_g1~~TRINITY_DN30416_c0_g1_i1.p1  ORF type:complete len:2733 (+),score=408.03 TRINITY_DN30416_c0_g1_i1:610-8199(+)